MITLDHAKRSKEENWQIPPPLQQMLRVALNYSLNELESVTRVLVALRATVWCSWALATLSERSPFEQMDQLLARAAEVRERESGDSGRAKQRGNGGWGGGRKHEREKRTGTYR